MRQSTFDLENASLILTSTGFVAVYVEDMGMEEQAELFGSDGVLPPQSLSQLVDDLLKTILATPDSSDAARLRSLANDLKASSEKVEMILSQLDGA